MVNIPNVFQTDFETELLKRDDNGCVECPTSAGTCPECPSGQQCQLKSPTCNSCSSYYCAPAITTKSTPIGGIVGGVIGGVAFLALIAAVLYYFLYYRKRHPVMLDEDYEDDEDFLDDEISGYESSKITSIGGPDSSISSPGSTANSSSNMQNSTSTTGNTSLSNSGAGITAAGISAAAAGGALVGANIPNGNGAVVAAPGVVNARKGLGPPRRKHNSRLSSYESFTKPKSNNRTKQQQLQARRTRQQRIIREANQQAQTQQIPADHPMFQPSNRNSVATSFSNASNILPIAYIPGVTVRPTKNNTRSIYSYDTDSLFSDLNTIENASIIGDVILANQNTATAEMYNHSPDSQVDQQQQQAQQQQQTSGGTMTAIKAQPRLVNVDRIEEEEEDESEDDLDDYGDIVPEESEDSDVDSDIGQITRATSVKKKDGQQLPPSQLGGSREILMDVGSSGNGGIPLEYINMDNKRDGGTLNSTTGSFVLNVEFDQSPVITPIKTHYTDNSNDRGSPFADAHAS
ncbi:OPY2 Protein OPY2 [Candida maltosa Xu316]